MQKRLLIIFSLLGAIFVPYMQIVANAGPAVDWPKWSKSNRSVLVELFTSQGCSSCPPADLLLTEIRRNAKSSKAPVYVLSFHVDYWNYLGWNDPYSVSWATARQYEYKRVFGKNSAYTPQAVVNGKVQFVGSSGRKMYQAIAKATTREDVVLLEQAAAKPGDLERDFEIRYLAENKEQISNMRLMLAYVDSSKTNSVAAGENSGSTLSHTNVVGQLQSVRLQPAGDSSLVTISKVKLKRLPTKDKPVVVFVQNTKTMLVYTTSVIES